MDYRERLVDAADDKRASVQASLDGRQAQLWTAMPGIVQSYDATAVTVEVQPAIQAMYTDPAGAQSFVNLPILPDVPVCFPRGGGYTATFPIQPGDECLVVIASRCIDSWWDQGGVQGQRELRMHDLSDGFAIVGPFSQKTKIANVSTTTVQVRSDDGARFFEVDTPNSKLRVVEKDVVIELDSASKTVHVTAGTLVTITSPNVRIEGILTVTDGASVTITCPNVRIEGNLNVTGTVIGNADGGPVGLTTHHHPGGGAPVPGS